jgi:tetratricopeptide (TPR) repeat protein
MAVKLKPDFAPAYVSRGGALLLQGKDEEAQKDFDKALKLDPNMKASIEIQLKQAKEARATSNQ